MKFLGEIQVKLIRGRPKTITDTNSKRKLDLQEEQAQEKFHHHFWQEGHQGIPDWKISLIDFAATKISSKELFWQYKLKISFSRCPE